MRTVDEIRCVKCGANARQCGGYLHRINAKGQPAVVECRPSCMARISDPGERLLAAIFGDESPPASLEGEQP